MSRRTPIPRLLHRLAALALMSPLACAAHVFTQPYTLPVPFSLYAGGAALTLVLSFALIGLMVTAPGLAVPANTAAAGTARAMAAPERLTAGRLLSLGLLLLTLATALFGSRSPFANFSMTFFWIGFVLALPYLVAFVGDVYAGLNPWRVLVDLLQQAGVARFKPRVALPAALGHVPALLLFIAFIWIELFGQLQPRGLGLALLAYTAINLVGAWLLGPAAWFRHGEFFGVMLRLIGRMAPRRAAGAEDRPTDRQRWRPPFVGLLDEPVRDVGLVLFILFMLSSTAFDGLHTTLPFATVFWKGLYPGLAPLFSPAPGQQYALSAQLYHLWQWVALVASPLLYLGVFVGFVALAQRLTGRRQRIVGLVCRFAPSLVPIAFVYHVTHYYTLLLAQGGQLLKLVSDPFGWGWDLFGTAQWTVEPWRVDVEVIWHTQVGLILLGHVVSVYLAHLEALRCFGSPRLAMLSQLPLLVLMVLFTTVGLWILSLPLAPGGG